MTSPVWRVCDVCGNEFPSTLAGTYTLIQLRDLDSAHFCSDLCLRCAANRDHSGVRRQILKAQIWFHVRSLGPDVLVAALALLAVTIVLLVK